MPKNNVRQLLNFHNFIQIFGFVGRIILKPRWELSFVVGSSQVLNLV